MKKRYNRYRLWINLNGGMLVLDVQVNDILTMKKNHPCGAKEMLVLRTGMDFRLRCVGCGREFLVPRHKIEKHIKKITRKDGTEDA
jgi:hypothetical protein